MNEHTFSKGMTIRIEFLSEVDTCRGIKIPRQEFGTVRRYSESGQLHYTITDPLTGRNDYWLSHLAVLDMSENVRVCDVTLPYSDEYVLDSVRLWIEYSGFQSDLILSCFAAATKFFQEHGLANREIERDSIFLDRTFGFLYSDFDEQALEVLRRYYRDWIFGSLESGCIGDFDQWSLDR